MPHSAELAQHEVRAAVDEPQLDGHHNSNGRPTSVGRARSDGHGQSAPSEADLPMADLGALLVENNGLRQRLASQPVIEQAKGILMGYYRIDSDTAFQLLRHWSQDSNTKLRSIAEQLIETTVHPSGRRPGPPHELVRQNLPSPLPRPRSHNSTVVRPIPPTPLS